MWTNEGNGLILLDHSDFNKKFQLIILIVPYDFSSTNFITNISVFIDVKYFLM